AGQAAGKAGVWVSVVGSSDKLDAHLPGTGSGVESAGLHGADSYLKSGIRGPVVFIPDTECGVQIGSAGFHQRERFIAQVASVLDGADAREHGAASSLITVCMGRDRKPKLAACVDDSRHFFVSECAFARVGVRSARTLGGKNLDDVYVMLGENTHDAAKIVGSAKSGRELGHVREVQQKPGKRQRNIRPHLVSRSDDARKVRHATFVKFAHAHVNEMLDSQNTGGGGPVLEGATRRGHVSKMRVSVYESGQEPASLEVDNLCAGRGRAGAFCHALNLASANNDGRITD